jgi:HK97 gp10 family phage protein
MPDSVRVNISGLREVEKTLDTLAPRSARNINRNVVTDVAREARDEAKNNAPRRDRRGGTLRKAIKARRRRGEPDVAQAAVYVTTGNSVKHDAWYWHFLEWGTRNGIKAHEFMTRSVTAIKRRLDSILQESFVRRFEKEMQRLARRQAKGKR